MGAAMLKLPPTTDPPRKLVIPAIRMIHRPLKNVQTIEDAKKATDLLLSLRLYLQTHHSS